MIKTTPTQKSRQFQKDAVQKLSSNDILKA